MTAIKDKDLKKVSGGDKTHDPFGSCEHFELGDSHLPFAVERCIYCKHFTVLTPASGKCSLSE